MIMSNKTQVTWNPKNKKHYVECGYIFTKMNDKFEVDVKDLTEGSRAPIKIRCDYCGKEYEMKWYSYKSIKGKSCVPKDSCGSCFQLKAKDAIAKKYGDYANMFFASKDKRINTNLSKYGVENVFSNEGIKEKAAKTNIAKYGVPYSQSAKCVREKTQNTCMEKYGVANYVELFRGKFIGDNSPSWKGGIKASRSERATNEYTQWRKDVFRRDLYTCQKCGARSAKKSGVKIHAHHINNWADYPESRYDPSNGITLCDKCHYIFHSRYEKKNNSIEQIKEYLIS